MENLEQHSPVRAPAPPCVSEQHSSVHSLLWPPLQGWARAGDRGQTQIQSLAGGLTQPGPRRGLLSERGGRWNGWPTPGAHGAALARPRAAQRKPQAAILQLEEECAWAVSNQPADGKRRGTDVYSDVLFA